IRSLSADCLPSLIKASAFGVLASQLFGRNFFNPLRITVKNMKDNLVLTKVRVETIPIRSTNSKKASSPADCQEWKATGIF
ncbi:hypothetical protein, partial [Bacillus sp. B4EP4a]|uniref:hypothetical protein n=1 Tax=Bacillus sp. B4EP4a TaxID=2590665 RepID=UPI0015EF801D